MVELYKKYRPKTLADVKGQDGVVRILLSKLKTNSLPRCILLSGPPGTGKTSIGRILRRELGCGKHDYNQVNSARFGGVASIRAVQSRMYSSPMGGKCRIWFFDEVHTWTRDAQNAALEMLEDTPDHVYFMLATTDPQKLLPAVRSRCTELQLKSLSVKLLNEIIEQVCLAENVENRLLGNNKKIIITEDVQDKIVENSEGSARKALVLLNQIMDLEDEEEQLNAIEKSTLEKQTEFLGRLLINPTVKWPEIAKALKASEQEDPEGLRLGILGYAKAVMLNNGKMSARAFDIIDIFRSNVYDSKHAGLVANCWELLNG